jgi:hypothetical protein
MNTQRISSSSHRYPRHSPFDGVRHALGRILIQGLIFALLGALLTETIAIVSARALPSAPTHWIALAIGLLTGYAAIITVALLETMRGIVSGLEQITAQLEKLASHTLHDAEALLHVSDGEAPSQGARSVPVAHQPVVSNEPGILLGDLLVEDGSSSYHHPSALVYSGKS